MARYTLEKNRNGTFTVFDSATGSTRLYMNERAARAALKRLNAR